ncbi:MAG: DNA polymerase/3'-5' exonuclease PolX [Methanoregula sp.]|jgi:DNA polymerase (family 10)
METPLLVNNTRVAAIFYEVSEILKIKGEKFKPQAYAKAAHAIETLPEDIADISKREKLEEIPGVGTHLAVKIKEILNTGHLEYLENLRQELPPGVRELVELEGIGPKKAIILSRELGITNKEGLEKAAKAGHIRDLPGFGELSEKNILRSIMAKSKGGRFLLGQVLPVAQDIVQQLVALPATKQISLAGSLRRKKETIGDVDILATSPEPGKVMDVFCSLSSVDRVLARGPTRSSVVLATGLPVDLRVVKEDQYGAALQYFTGSKDHNISLRRLALERNWKLNEYGISDLSTGKKIAGKSEDEVYRMLGLPFIEPELRENRGEIEAAQKGSLPDIVPYTAVRGDLHVHTSWSDGKNTVLEMAEAAKSLGYEYIAICDHAKSPHFSRGLTEKQIVEQGKEIERVNRTFDGFEVLAGTECSINDDGTLDVGNTTLQDLDLVVASVHSSLKMPKNVMTQRMLAAMQNEHLDIIGHPTGRIIQQREPVELDLTAFFRTAAELLVILEINAFPNRLDLSDINCMKAREYDVRFALGSDAHTRANLSYMEFGVATARRGWLGAKDIVNTLSIRDLRTVLGS